MDVESRGARLEGVKHSCPSEFTIGSLFLEARNFPSAPAICRALLTQTCKGLLSCGYSMMHKSKNYRLRQRPRPKFFYPPVHWLIHPELAPSSALDYFQLANVFHGAGCYNYLPGYWKFCFEKMFGVQPKENFLTWSFIASRLMSLWCSWIVPLTAIHDSDCKKWQMFLAISLIYNVPRWTLQWRQWVWNTTMVRCISVIIITNTNRIFIQGNLILFPFDSNYINSHMDSDFMHSCMLLLLYY